MYNLTDISSKNIEKGQNRHFHHHNNSKENLYTNFIVNSIPLLISVMPKYHNIELMKISFEIIKKPKNTKKSSPSKKLNLKSNETKKTSIKPQKSTQINKMVISEKLKLSIYLRERFDLLLSIKEFKLAIENHQPESLSKRERSTISFGNDVISDIKGRINKEHYGTKEEFYSEIDTIMKTANDLVVGDQDFEWRKSLADILEIPYSHILDESIKKLDFEQRYRVFNNLLEINDSEIWEVYKIVTGSSSFEDKQELEIDLVNLSDEIIKKLDNFVKSRQSSTNLKIHS